MRDLTQSCSVTVTGHFLQARATLIVQGALKVTLTPALARYGHSKPQKCHGTQRVKVPLGEPTGTYSTSHHLLRLSPVPGAHLDLQKRLWVPQESHLGTPCSCQPSLSHLRCTSTEGLCCQLLGCFRKSRAVLALQAGRRTLEVQITIPLCFCFLADFAPPIQTANSQGSLICLRSNQYHRFPSPAVTVTRARRCQG